MERTDPFSELEEIFDHVTGLGSPLTGEIPVDVIDTGDAVVVIAELPGRDPDSIGVQLQNERRLELSAPEATDDIEGEYVVRGRQRGPVSRSVRLPATVDESQTDANYDDGLLTIRLGKPGEDSGTDIPVN